MIKYIAPINGVNFVKSEPLDFGDLINPQCPPDLYLYSDLKR